LGVVLCCVVVSESGAKVRGALVKREVR